MTFQQIVRRYAAGDATLRAEAIAGFHDKLREKARMCDSPERDTLANDPCMLFMSEVDNKCPDFILRAHYRERVLKEIPDGD